MEPFAILFMSVTIGSITALVSYCLFRILRSP